MITDIRLVSQQLTSPRFSTPQDVVAWMGAVQAQEFSMSKWAVGVRTKTPSLSAVNEALATGKILRLHILRPTWHYVSPENVRWMLDLTGLRIKKAWMGYAKTANLGVDDKMLVAANKLLEKFLHGKKALSAEEISNEFKRAGLAYEPRHVRYILACAEADGLLCGGAPKGNKNTYLWMEEYVKPFAKISRDEALGKLARLYFQSHSPASLADFTWWSGLSLGEARRAMEIIQPELTEEAFGACRLWVHESCAGLVKPEHTVHLLPSFDEFLISYKDRTACLEEKHHPKAFNRFGTFYPVVLSGGKVVGNWAKITKKNGTSVDFSFFIRNHGADKKLLEAAQARYLDFLKK